MAETLTILATALEHHQAGRLCEAEALYRQILESDPNDADATQLLGMALMHRGQHAEALGLIEKSLELQPEAPDCHCNHGRVLFALGRYPEAVTSLREAIALKGDYPEAYLQLAHALNAAGDANGAVAAFEKTLELEPDNPRAANDLGLILATQEKWAKATDAYERAISLKPDSPEAHFNLGLLLLMTGQWERGWKEWEWRWKLIQTFIPADIFEKRYWDGSDLKGRTILLHPEGGMGDVIQFARFAAAVKARGGRVLLGCGPELESLLKTVEGVERIVAIGQRVPEFDVHCPLQSVTRLLNVTAENHRLASPYVKADAARAAAWGRRMASDGRCKIGLVWSGDPRLSLDQQRSLSLSDYAPLRETPDVRFYSLQKGPAAAQASTPPAGMELIDWSAELNDFSDTAALVANLDLVITVDTAVAHLAGAMGKPVWNILPFHNEWRWIVNRSDTPWYPTMRLFRPKPGNWASAVRPVAAELARFVSECRSRSSRASEK